MVAFIILAALLLAGGIGVITLKQPVHAALSLVGTLLALAATYVTLEANFLAAVQVIAYAGAIMVLFLFVIMLLNVEGQAPDARLKWFKPAVWVTGGLTLAALAYVTLYQTGVLADPEAIRTTLDGGNVSLLAESLFGDYLFAFHLVAILLMTGIVAALSIVQRPGEES